MNNPRRGDFLIVLWIEFLTVAGIVVYSGSRLTYFADIISEKTGMGRTWIGVVLLASMTSLPELITGVSSVTAAHTIDIAVADILGSCVFNLAIIAVLDLLYRPGAILSKAEQGHILGAGFGMAGLAVVAAGLFLSRHGIYLQLLWIGLYTPILLFLYFYGMQTIFRFEKVKISKERKVIGARMQYEKITRSKACRGFALHAAIIIAAASLLPFVGEDLAEASGLGQTFIGLLFIALATSLPEVATSVSALRIGAIDLAVGNLFGSNLFNLGILAIDDLLSIKGPLLLDVSASQQLPALAAILMSAIAILTLFYQPVARRIWRISWIAAAIALIYFLNTFGVYVLETSR